MRGQALVAARAGGPTTVASSWTPVATVIALPLPLWGSTMVARRQTPSAGGSIPVSQPLPPLREQVVPKQLTL